MQKDYSKVEMESDGNLSKNKPSRIRKRVLLTISGTPAVIILIVLVALTRARTVFPTTMRPFDLNDKSISYPEKPYTISSVFNVTMCAVVVLCFTMLWFICEGTLNSAVAKKNIPTVLFTVYFAMLGACFVVILVNSMKNLAGHLRPYFLSACEPNQTMVEELTSRNTTWVDENMTRTICTSERSLRHRRSFPSGHSAEAWYAMTLSILLLQYTKNNYTENLSQSLMLPFKAVFQFFMFAFASWIGITRTLDHHHFWWDVLAGSLLGALVAVVMFYEFVKPVMESAARSPCVCAEGITGSEAGEEENSFHSQEEVAQERSLTQEIHTLV